MKIIDDAIEFHSVPGLASNLWYRNVRAGSGISSCTVILKCGHQCSDVGRPCGEGLSEGVRLGAADARAAGHLPVDRISTAQGDYDDDDDAGFQRRILARITAA
jgi:hypothetical protein